MESRSGSKPRLLVRNTTDADIPAVAEPGRRVYGEGFGYSPEMLAGQRAHFPQGQFVAVYDGRVIGYCATFRIGTAQAMARHTWAEVTGGGFTSRHDPEGDWLYGMDMAVDPEYRGMRMGRRLYGARKRLRLRGIVFGGRLPRLARAMKKYASPEEYLQAVVEGRQRDPTLSFQLRNGFEADSTLNAEMVLFADLRLEDLARARNNGSVQNLKDRRHDLCQLHWPRRP